jgi:Holliday junction DNA helicase RuvB
VLDCDEQRFLSSPATQRPKSFDTYIGQKDNVDQLKIYVQAARARNMALDHVLLSGPPGLGKTTLAQIIAAEMGAQIHTTSGPVIDRAGDLAALLTALNHGDILFIDEIHRLKPHIEEILYPAMEDFQLDLMVGEGPGARSIRLDLHPFTLVAATTKPGDLTAPLRDRFGIQLRLDYYRQQDLTQILHEASMKMGMTFNPEALDVIASRARGTPRVALRLLRRLRDFIDVHGVSTSLASQISGYLEQLDIDAHGLDKMDRRVLRCIEERYDGGPVGLEALAISLGESKATLEDLIEPYLVQQDFLQRTPRGRKITAKGRAHLQNSLL